MSVSIHFRRLAKTLFFLLLTAGYVISAPMHAEPSKNTATEKMPVAPVPGKTPQIQSVSCVVGMGLPNFTFRDDTGRAVDFKSPPEGTRRIQLFSGCGFDSLFLRFDVATANDETNLDFVFDDVKYNHLTYLGIGSTVYYEYKPISVVSLSVGMGYRSSDAYLYSSAHDNVSAVNQRNAIFFLAFSLYASDVFFGADYFKRVGKPGIFVDEVGIVFGVVL